MLGSRRWLWLSHLFLMTQMKMLTFRPLATLVRLITPQTLNQVNTFVYLLVVNYIPWNLFLDRTVSVQGTNISVLLAADDTLSDINHQEQVAVQRDARPRRAAREPLPPRKERTPAWRTLMERGKRPCRGFCPQTCRMK